MGRAALMPSVRPHIDVTTGRCRGRKMRLANSLGDRRLPINAPHRRAFDRLGRSMAAGTINDGGNVQAVELTGHRFWLGMLWSPRRLRPFRELVAAASETAPQRQSPAPASMSA